MFNVRLFFFICIFIISCQGNQQGNSANSETETTEKGSETMILFGETMELHDEAMEQMGKIYNLRKSLSGKLDSLSADSDESTSNDHIKTLVQDLENAEEAMMNWMSQFQTDLKDDDNEDSRKYYEDQKEKISVVWTEMQNAMQAAEQELGN